MEKLLIKSRAGSALSCHSLGTGEPCEVHPLLEGGTPNPHPGRSDPFPVCCVPSKGAVQAVQAQNQICVLDIDIQGVKNIKKTDLNPIYISVQPPSIEILVSARLALPLAVRGNQRPALQPRGSPFPQPPLFSGPCTRWGGHSQAFLCPVQLPSLWLSGINLPVLCFLSPSWMFSTPWLWTPSQRGQSLNALIVLCAGERRI